MSCSTPLRVVGYYLPRVNSFLYFPKRHEIFTFSVLIFQSTYYHNGFAYCFVHIGDSIFHFIFLRKYIQQIDLNSELILYLLYLIVVGFIFLKYVFITVTANLWKSGNPVSKTLVSWKQRFSLARKRLIQERLSAFL